MDIDELKRIIEAALLAAPQPLSLTRMAAIFAEDETPSRDEMTRALEQLREESGQRGVELVEVASGFRYQVREDIHPWVTRLWAERPQKYSRALLETLALIAYRQPVTRGEIEQVRGVGVSTGMIRTLEEREWIRVVGFRDVPGKPALYGTTKLFLDYFKLKSLDELPSLAEVRDLEAFDPQLSLEGSVTLSVPGSAGPKPANVDLGEAQPTALSDRHGAEPASDQDEDENSDADRAEPEHVQTAADSEETRA